LNLAKNGDFMKSAIIATLIAFAPLGAFAQNASPLRIAELTAHRIDRLIQGKKIDAGFVTRLEKIEVSAVNAPAPAAFRSLVSQTAPTTGTPIQLELIFDAAGKPLSFSVLPGGVAGADPKWPSASAQALLEASLHGLEASTDMKLMPFTDALKDLVLTKGTLKGSPVARVQVTSSSTTDKLNVYLMFDGMIMATEVIPEPAAVQ
jgi:hypothetical protein